MSIERVEMLENCRLD